MNIAVFMPNWIGDAVMATPAVRALRQRYPEARMVWVGKPYIAGVIEGSPWFNDHVCLDSAGSWFHRWPAAAWKLRRRRIDLAVLFANTFRSAWVAWLAGCGRRLGMNLHGRGWLLNDALEPVRDRHGGLTPSPVIDDYNRLAQKAGSAWPGYGQQLFTTPADEQAADLVLQRLGVKKESELVCFNPGAAFGAAKHWPALSFAELAQSLVGKRGSQVLIMCGPNERKLARQIAELAARPAVCSLAEETLSLGLTKALIRRCDLLVTTDSGPRHIAAAFDRPVLTLFGPTHQAWTKTYHAQEIPLQKPVPCGPCQLRVCPVDHRCMKDLTPGEVFAAAQELLEARPPRRLLQTPERRAS